ncbi:MAG TPA: HD domain-containing phosphohydrolase, partial [Terriglobales bacterium]|nr:HD domain-containing phosphohydrolase [Terriglobales bacterium]
VQHQHRPVDSLRVERGRQRVERRNALGVLESGQQFELMLSDLMMADLDGMGLLERTKEKFPEMPVVMVTAVHDISAALKAIRDGAYDYLLKPFEREQLLATVHRALENRRLRMENQAYQNKLEELVKARTQQLQKTMSDLERSYDITLQALGGALDMKDAETEGHSKRVTAFTIAIARQLGLSPEQIRVIARGAFLHDIGKMAIPDAILRKPAALDPDETAIVREHCYRGFQILRNIPFLTEAAEIVYSHQERWDGTGYPRGLKGEEIPLGARIFSIADTLDAITSDRPYRPAQSVAAALKEIKAWRGRQFDPKIVDTFLSMPENIWGDLRKEIEAQIHPFAYSSAAKTSS